jgi:hypothetical protein
MLPIDQVFRTVHIGMLDHYNVSTRKLQETIQFYQDVLGFVNGHRPPFNFTLGCTVPAIRCCTSMIFLRRTRSSATIQA